MGFEVIVTFDCAWRIPDDPGALEIAVYERRANCRFVEGPAFFAVNIRTPVVSCKSSHQLHIAWDFAMGTALSISPRGTSSTGTTM